MTPREQVESSGEGRGDGACVWASNASSYNHASYPTTPSPSHAREPPVTPLPRLEPSLADTDVTAAPLRDDVRPLAGAGCHGGGASSLNDPAPNCTPRAANNATQLVSGPPTQNPIPPGRVRPLPRSPHPLRGPLATVQSSMSRCTCGLGGSGYRIYAMPPVAPRAVRAEAG